MTPSIETLISYGLLRQSCGRWKYRPIARDRGEFFASSLEFAVEMATRAYLSAGPGELKTKREMAEAADSAIYEDMHAKYSDKSIEDLEYILAGLESVPACSLDAHRREFACAIGRGTRAAVSTQAARDVGALKSRLRIYIAMRAEGRQDQLCRA